MLQQPIFKITKQITDNFDFDDLMANPDAMPIIDANMGAIRFDIDPDYDSDYETVDDSDYILPDWRALSLNRNACHILEKYINKVRWTQLFGNEGAISIIDNNIDKIHWPNPYMLSCNKNATHILEKHPDKIVWSLFSGLRCKEAVKIMEKYPERVCWRVAIDNPFAMDLVEKNLDKLYPSEWEYMCTVPHAIHILEKHIDKIAWEPFSYNTRGVHILEKNLDKVCWKGLSVNSSATHILEQNMDKIHLCYLVNNPNAGRLIEKFMDQLRPEHWVDMSDNPGLIPLLKKNVDKISWDRLIIGNDNAMCIIKDNLDMLNDQDWEFISTRSDIMQLYPFDYETMKEKNSVFADELARVVFNPVRMCKISEKYNMEFSDLLDVY